MKKRPKTANVAAVQHDFSHLKNAIWTPEAQAELRVAVAKAAAEAAGIPYDPDPVAQSWNDTMAKAGIGVTRKPAGRRPPPLNDR